mmetsp:Transcript_34576/g.25711  ORF Transcript_34576/g.25711 Transcript_34576/m.25711 type:complete len:169 (+) Transcript_34576:415-921(+)
MVQFSIKDTGLGIEASRIPNLFKLFEKDSKAGIEEFVTVNQRTAKLGLPISQRLCNLMGGEIMVKSEVGQGSTFYFTLPLNYYQGFGDIHNRSSKTDLLKGLELSPHLLPEDLEENKSEIRQAESQEQAFLNFKKREILQQTSESSSQSVNSAEFRNPHSVQDANSSY